MAIKGILHKSSNQSRKFFNSIREHTELFLFIGLLFMIVSPLLFTKAISIVDLTNGDKIGDTIGGITSPIVNFIGAVLVYFAFQAQVSANELLTSSNQAQIETNKETNRDRILSTALKKNDELKEIVREMKVEIQELKYKNESGVKAVGEIFNFVNTEHLIISNKDLLSYFNKINYVLSSIDFVSREIYKYPLSENVELGSYKGFARARFMQSYVYEFEPIIIELKKIPHVKTKYTLDEEIINKELRITTENDYYRLATIVARRIRNIEETIYKAKPEETEKNIFWLDRYEDYKNTFLTKSTIES